MAGYCRNLLEKILYRHKTESTGRIRCVCFDMFLLLSEAQRTLKFSSSVSAHLNTSVLNLVKQFLASR